MKSKKFLKPNIVICIGMDYKRNKCGTVAESSFNAAFNFITFSPCTEINFQKNDFMIKNKSYDVKSDHTILNSNADFCKFKITEKPLA